MMVNGASAGNSPIFVISSTLEAVAVIVKGKDGPALLN